jgi:sortase A
MPTSEDVYEITGPVTAPVPPPKKRRHRSAPIVKRAGIAMILVGTVLLGYMGWEMYGTNWVSHRKHAQLTASMEKAWDEKSGDRTVKFGGEQVTALIKIPKFGKDYVVPVIEGTSEEVLAAGYGHFKGTASAGSNGNYAVAAHRVTHGEPLRRMPELQPGDKVIVETREGTYTYVLDTGGDDLRVPMTETWAIDEKPVNPDAGEPNPIRKPVDDARRLITLTTCAEIFHTEDRLIAFGHLESVLPR